MLQFLSVIFAVSIVVALVYIILGMCNVVDDEVVPAAIFYIVLSCFLMGSVLSHKQKPIEFKASEYTLDLKVTEFQGQMDTTYVLTPKL